MNSEVHASRTLVKSPPELWAECSQTESLARHLDGAFGEIRITRLEPESAVDWEGEGARGTVRIDPSGWGTKVTLTATLSSPVSSEPEPSPPLEEPSQPERLLDRLFGRRRRRAAAGSELPPAPEPEAAPEGEALLTAALDSLGQAHHRPYSRA